ncbi:MAG TPA: low temperature requirement protein A [Thermoleophilaceae bacterium]|nr:low temperature requirement protein A [Thermoleophilaceae bacterium]
MTAAHPLRRSDEERKTQSASALELFYDLVFVFAITQVSHHLLEHLTWEGAGQSALMLLMVWWSWNYTTWLTNELNADTVAVRLVVILLMLGSLLMAIAIPEAFGDQALLFAGAYVAIQVGRSAFLAFAGAHAGSMERLRATRILIWFTAAGVFWIAGALADGSARTILWLIALAIDYGAPAVTYWVPGIARVPLSAWDVSAAHFAERFQLFVIIALGESIVITGATTAELDLDTGRAAAFAVAFLGSAALWWLYFNYVATIAERRLSLAEDRTAIARDGYTYLHVLMIAGVIVSAVGDELVIAHPEEHLHGAELAAVAAGPAIYLMAHVLFRLRMTHTVSVPRLTGAAICVALGLVGGQISALALAVLLLAVLVGVILWEQRRAARRRARGEPTPLERLAGSAPPA